MKSLSKSANAVMPTLRRTRFPYLAVWSGVLVWLAVSVSSVGAQDRTALVIANFDYGEYQLPYVKADATLVAEALRIEGFRVTTAENVDVKQLKSSLEQFARGTVTRGVAICYFAGLTGQYQTYNSKGIWWNHLQGAGRPADARNPERESFALTDIFKLFADHSSSRTNLLIVDSPTANPFLKARENGPVGLKEVAASELPPDLGLLISTHAAASDEQPVRLASIFARELPRGRESLAACRNAILKSLPTPTSGPATTFFATHPHAEAAAWPKLTPTASLSAESPRSGEIPGQQWTNSQGMVFCWCPPGEFRMGDAELGRAEFEDAEPVDVSLTRGFWIGKYEVTQIEAERLKAGGNRYPFPGKLLPQHAIQQGQTSKLIAALNDSERKAGRLPSDWEYALPTEAQWEYACRAGTTTRYSFGDDVALLSQHANFADQRLLEDDSSLTFAAGRFNDGFGRALAPVGTYRPNAWGLHDMHGNVAEWCADRYLPSLLGGPDPLVDEKRKDAAPESIIRGGSWCSIAKYCESAFRNSEFSGGNAKNRDYIGFRLVLKQK